MRMMHPTLFLPTSFRLAATVLLAIVPVIFATPSPELLSPRGVDFRDLQPPNLGGWAGLGCFTDDPDQPALTSVYFSSPPNMTAWYCFNVCRAYFTEMAGIVNGTDCRCGNVTSAGTIPVSPSLCNIPCVVPYDDQNCGGINTIAIYGGDSPQKHQATFVQNVGPWTLSGCFNDSDTAKTLTVPKSGLGGQGNNTVENCLDVCGAAGYNYAGVEGLGGGFCWCDHQINQGKTALVDSSSCMTPCPGDNLELCGGPHSLVIYKKS